MDQQPILRTGRLAQDRKPRLQWACGLLASLSHSAALLVSMMSWHSHQPISQNRGQQHSSKRSPTRPHWTPIILQKSHSVQAARSQVSCSAPSWLSHLFPETSAGCFHFTNEKIEANLFILFICSSLPYAGKHMKWSSASLSKHEMSVLSTKPTCPCLENAFLNAAYLHWGSRHLPMVMKGPVERHNKQAFISQDHTPWHKWVSIPWY